MEITDKDMMLMADITKGLKLLQMTGDYFQREAALKDPKDVKYLEQLLSTNRTYVSDIVLQAEKFFQKVSKDAYITTPSGVSYVETNTSMPIHEDRVDGSELGHIENELLDCDDVQVAGVSDGALVNISSSSDEDGIHIGEVVSMNGLVVDKLMANTIGFNSGFSDEDECDKVVPVLLRNSNEKKKRYRPARGMYGDKGIQKDEHGDVITPASIRRKKRNDVLLGFMADVDDLGTGKMVHYATVLGCRVPVAAQFDGVYYPSDLLRTIMVDHNQLTSSKFVFISKSAATFLKAKFDSEEGLWKARKFTDAYLFLLNGEYKNAQDYFSVLNVDGRVAVIDAMLQVYNALAAPQDNIVKVVGAIDKSAYVPIKNGLIFRHGASKVGFDSWLRGRKKSSAMCALAGNVALPAVCSELCGYVGILHFSYEDRDKHAVIVHGKNFKYSCYGFSTCNTTKKYFVDQRSLREHVSRHHKLNVAEMSTEEYAMRVDKCKLGKGNYLLGM